MATSFAFLDKPAKGLTTVAQGPKPKPTTSARGFLDLSNPWAVPGVTAGAPARPSASSGTTAKTPAKSTAKPKADIPTRGYNYTESSTASGQPAAVRQREVDRATMSGQAAGQRKAAAKAQPEPEPVRPVVATVAPRPIGPPAQPAYNPLADLQPPAPAQPSRPAGLWQMAPTAEQAMTMRPGSAGSPNTQAAPARVNVPTAGYNYTDAPPATAPAPTLPAPGTNVPTPIAPANQPQARGPFYGYAPPGPLTVPYNVALQPGQLQPYLRDRRAKTDRAQYTNFGMRALMSDEALAIEDARRQRDAAGGLVALQSSGMFRPWSSYSPAEKYYLRFGVMPQGDPLPPDTSGIAAMEASRAQNERLKDAYYARHGYYPRWDNYAYRRPDQQPGAIAAAAGMAAPTATSSTFPVPVSAQAQVNTAALAQVNPAAVRNGVVVPGAATENDVSVVARQILQRYRPELPAESMNFIDIMAILAQYIPPQDRAAMYKEDAEWLGAFLLSE